MTKGPVKKLWHIIVKEGEEQSMIHFEDRSERDAAFEEMKNNDKIKIIKNLEPYEMPE